VPKRFGIKAIVNPFDSYALEEGVRLKEKHGGKVTAISMGPPQARTCLKMPSASAPMKLF